MQRSGQKVQRSGPASAHHSTTTVFCSAIGANTPYTSGGATHCKLRWCACCNVFSRCKDLGQLQYNKIFPMLFYTKFTQIARIHTYIDSSSVVFLHVPFLPLLNRSASFSSSSAQTTWLVSRSIVQNVAKSSFVFPRRVSMTLPT